MLQIYLTDLSAYNKGFLVGDWITLPCDDEELTLKIAKVLKQGEALCAFEYGYEEHEEYFITDWDFEDGIELFEVAEYSNPYNINKEVEIIQEHAGKRLKELSFLLTQGYASNVEDAISKLDDVILHEEMTMEDIAVSLINECYDINSIPTIIANHIDYEGIGRDLEIDGNYTVINNDVLEYLG